MSEKLFICPSCAHEFRRRNHANCPNCSSPLKAVVTPSAPVVEPAAEEKKVESSPSIGERVSAPDEIPAIYYMGTEDRTNPRTGKTRTVKLYRVEYIGILYTGWVYCPSCWRKLYQNQMMDTGAFHQEMMCKDCDTVTTFIFQSNRAIFAR